jgi:glutaredoxin
MKLHTKEKCPACDMVKQFMRDANINDVQIVNSQNDFVALERMKEAGVMTFPALEIETGKFIAPSQAIVEFLVERENNKS